MQQDQFQKPYSEETAKMIDQEVRKMIDKEYRRAQKLLAGRHEELEILAKQLLETEVLLKSDVERLIGPRPHEIKKATSSTTTENVHVASDDAADGQEARDLELGQPKRAPVDDA
jgi:cell division protease FtsH